LHVLESLRIVADLVFLRVNAGQLQGDQRRLQIALVLANDDAVIGVRRFRRCLGGLQGDLVRRQLIFQGRLVELDQQVAFLDERAVVDEPLDGGGVAAAALTDLTRQVTSLL
jgi:hypothetical protein